jgi:lysophospholipase L1-like esterase
MKLPFIVFSILAAATVQAQSTTATPAADAAKPATAFVPLMGQAVTSMPANPSLPTLWLIGDSTVRNGSKGDGSNMNQWGWGAPLEYYFDLKKINVINRAYGGTSSRSFYNQQWKKMVGDIKKGDIVIMQFGANDNGSPATGKGAIKGVGDETQEVNGETIHTFGWYMEQYVKETRDKGATPIIASLTPRKKWNADGTRLIGDSTTHGGWAAQAAKESNAQFVDLNELICLKYGQLGKEKVDSLYVPSPTESLHTGWDGAVVNAECVVSGLKALKDDPLADYFSERGKFVTAVDVSKPADAKPAASAATATATK